MLTSTIELLETAQRNAYAIGAFNIYNLEGVKAVINAAEALQSPAMLQLHPSALSYGKSPSGGDNGAREVAGSGL